MQSRYSAKTLHRVAASHRHNEAIAEAEGKQAPCGRKPTGFVADPIFKKPLARLTKVQQMQVLDRKVRKANYKRRDIEQGAERRGSWGTMIRLRKMFASATLTVGLCASPCIAMEYSKCIGAWPANGTVTWGEWQEKCSRESYAKPIFAFVMTRTGPYLVELIEGLLRSDPDAEKHPEAFAMALKSAEPLFPKNEKADLCVAYSNQTVTLNFSHREAFQSR